MKKILVAAIVALIRLYQAVISPHLPAACRYVPTCSEYSRQAFLKYGICKGLILTIKRLAACHPWGGSGYAPLK